MAQITSDVQNNHAGRKQTIEFHLKQATNVESAQHHNMSHSMSRSSAQTSSRDFQEIDRRIEKPKAVFIVRTLEP